MAGQTTLVRALDRGRSHRPPLHVESIFTADEYTHDVLIPFEDGRYLAYDTT